MLRKYLINIDTSEDVFSFLLAIFIEEETKEEQLKVTISKIYNVSRVWRYQVQQENEWRNNRNHILMR